MSWEGELGKCVEIRGQTEGVCSLPSVMCILGTELTFQAWQRVPLPIESALEQMRFLNTVQRAVYIQKSEKEQSLIISSMNTQVFIEGIHKLMHFQKTKQHIISHTSLRKRTFPNGLHPTGEPRKNWIPGSLSVLTELGAVASNLGMGGWGQRVPVGSRQVRKQR